MTKETKNLIKAYIKAGFVDVTGGGSHVKLKPPVNLPVPAGQAPMVIISCSASDGNAIKAQLREAKKWGVEPK